MVPIDLFYMHNFSNNQFLKNDYAIIGLFHLNSIQQIIYRRIWGKEELSF